MKGTAQPREEFAVRMGDNALVLGQRLSEWCGHAPVLEEDIALANTALDLIGQAKMWLGLAGELGGHEKSADDLAFLRDVRAFRNCLLVEHPNTDYAYTLMRQFLFDAWHYAMLEGLTHSAEERFAEIAEKSVKEARYHRERSTDLVVRLGDGSAESHQRMQTALEPLWRFTEELVVYDDVEETLAGERIIPNATWVSESYFAHLHDTLREATLTPPTEAHQRRGGKQGLHTEALGHLLSDMQWLQRAYPGLEW